ncbi:NRAMP family divalent metal transporter [Terrilactibacillus laevilacticus]|uniref:NRAMP family divalent metal transporter n=1 Tax=Terrilactibacillus laevilacticus TaxID=1380157 RepID=A0ABW5PMZ2_9BACI|nr:NRAMP family divalent metal transporter [Terrilactibacillus laevilacticus]
MGLQKPAQSIDSNKKKMNWSVLLGAAFLMATSSIGPGFLTQTTVFTQSLTTSFGFIILISIILDIVAQLNVWRIIAVTEKRGQDIANMVLPGLGFLLSLLIVIGGLAFNIGNIAGAGLGFNVLFGIDPKWGAAISAIIAIIIFSVKEAGKAMDRFAQIAGVVMILLMIYIAISTNPPAGTAFVKTFTPDKIDIFAIITLVGGSVGGYITFAGGHRLLEAGIKGKKALPQVTRSSVTGILITGVMRVALFLAVLGVVSQGLKINADNPAASVFQLAAGNLGYKIFGLVMWAAALTSVIGAAYTSVSFIRTFHESINQHYRKIIIGFIIVSTLSFIVIGQPVQVLVIVGAINAFILPIALGTLLIAANKKRIVGDYKHPLWMTILGVIVAVAMAAMSIYTVYNIFLK